MPLDDAPKAAPAKAAAPAKPAAPAPPADDELDLSPAKHDSDIGLDSPLPGDIKGGSDVFSSDSKAGTGSGVSPMFDELDTLDLDMFNQRRRQRNLLESFHRHSARSVEIRRQRIGRQRAVARFRRAEARRFEPRARRRGRR